MKTPNQKADHTSDLFEYKGKIMRPPSLVLSTNPEEISEYEKNGHFAQLKFKGSRALVEMKPGEIILWDGDQKPHSHKPSEGLLSNLKELHEAVCPDEVLVLDGELVHGKFIIHDLIVSCSEYVDDWSFVRRYVELDRITGNQLEHEKESGSHVAIFIRNHLWLAEMFAFNLEGTFNNKSKLKAVEGLIIRDPNS